MKRRSLLLAAVPLAAVPLSAQAESWPDRPLRWIVPFPPGGAIDAMTRLLAAAIAPKLGQPIVVENRAGAGGTIGTGVAAGIADGHALVSVSISHAVNTTLYPSLPYDPAALVAVGPLGIVPNILVVPAASPFTDVAGVIAAARSRPGALTYGSAGSGTSIHLAAVMFEQAAGLQLGHAPYRGSGPALADLLPGRIDMMFDSVTSAGAHIREGRLRALGVTTATRIASFPAVPTIAEAGLPGYAMDPWFAVLAPRSMPEAGRARCNAALLEALPTLANRFALLGMEPMAQRDPTALAAFIAAETAKWAEVVRAIGLRPE